jgi:hypothetical protein
VFVAEYTCGLLATSFPNMTPTQIQAAVAGMMQIEDKRAFKHHMRDFLVQVRLSAWYSDLNQCASCGSNRCACSGVGVAINCACLLSQARLSLMVLVTMYARDCLRIVINPWI